MKVIVRCFTVLTETRTHNGSKVKTQPEAAGAVSTEPAGENTHDHFNWPLMKWLLTQ